MICRDEYQRGKLSNRTLHPGDGFHSISVSPPWNISTLHPSASSRITGFSCIKFQCPISCRLSSFLGIFKKKLKSKLYYDILTESHISKTVRHPSEICHEFSQLLQTIGFRKFLLWLSETGAFLTRLNCEMARLLLSGQSWICGRMA